MTTSILSAEHIAQAALRNAAYQAQQTAKAQAIAELIKANPHLTPDDNHGGVTTAAKNIRAELKRAFPAIKFSVRSKSYTGGNSINIHWTDGPTSDQVEAIAGRYKHGSFNGMDDSYEFVENAWGDAFGSAYYIFTNRDYSDAMLESVIGRVCRYFGGMKSIPTAEDYNKGRIWNLRNDNGIDMRLEIHRALQKHTFCITKPTGSTQ